jgi:16S rRNA (adenine1518-N6/adenine1519-N6)-dimethyltransferase
MGQSNHHINLTSPSQVRKLLGDLNFRPSKVLGQNFLIDRNILEIIVQAAELSSDDTVLEIGPGLGVLTEQLLDASGHVIAVEKDRKLYGYLKERFRDRHNLELINNDALKVSGLRYCNKVTANLPYSVGNRILVDFVHSEKPPEQIIVTVQKEVAQRITALPGNKDYGLLSVWTGLVYDAELVRMVNPTCFLPRPEIRSGIIKMIKHNRFSLSADEKKFFYRITKHAFSMRRKQLVRILDKAPADIKLPADAARNMLINMNINEKARPENLTVDDWCLVAGEIVSRKIRT